MTQSHTRQPVYTVGTGHVPSAATPPTTNVGADLCVRPRTPPNGISRAILTLTIALLLATLTPTPAHAQDATPLPDVGTLLPDADQTGEVLLAARNDLELLANNLLSPAERPDGWTGSYDITDPQMALKLRLDLENLASQLATERPDGWFGVQATSAYATARDIRHDLELLADTHIAPSLRPPNWMGDNPVMRCDRATQALVLLLTSQQGYTPAAEPGSPTYCRDLAIEVSVVAETRLLDGTRLTRPTPPPDDAADAASTGAPVSIVGDTALAFSDRSATELTGVIPPGTAVTPVARSYAQFSRMTLVRGEGFQLFVDYQNTTLDRTAFEALGNINVITVETFCEAAWCL